MRSRSADFLLGGVMLLASLAACSPARSAVPTSTVAPLPPSASPTVATTPTTANVATVAPGPTPPTTATPSAEPAAATPTVAPTPGAVGSPTTDQFEITAANSGQTFAYPLTSRFQIILDGQTYPRADLAVSCTSPDVLGPISNLPSVAPPQYAVRYEGVTPGSCTIVDRAFRVTIQITAPGATPATQPSAPSAPGGPTASPAAEAGPPGTHPGGTPIYLDDRSSGADVVRSYFNAIARREYDRAYSYWEPAAAPGPPPYAQFKAGYADTRTVQLTLGPVWSQGAAGSAYESVAVALSATLTSGASQNYVGCYTLRLADPPIQDSPPFHPWAIQSATVQDKASAADAARDLANACNQDGSPPGIPITPSPTPGPTDVSIDRYLDDRSTPEEVLRSLVNAINRKEYDRAYSYWEPGATGLPTYSAFKAGYADTASVTLTTGTTVGDVAAGNLYFQVPATLVAHTTDGQTHTYVGCYRLHLGQPAVQDLPPYRPIAIQAATVQSVANGADAASLMGRACQ